MKQTLTGLRRRLGWDRNPLRRRVDRVEAAVFAGLVVAFLIGAPVLGLVAGRVTDGMELRQHHSERAWRQVPATLLVSAATVADPVSGSAYAWVPARWRAPGRPARRGLVWVDTAARAGQHVRVWTDASGRLTTAPLTRPAIQLNVLVAALIAPVVLGLGLLTAGGSTRLILNRRRLAGWNQAWDAAGPRWTPQP